MNVAGWILMVFVSNGACAAPQPCPELRTELKVTIPYQHKRECLSAAREFVIPPDLSCPANADCAVPLGVEDVVVARVCNQGFVGTN